MTMNKKTFLISIITASFFILSSSQVFALSLYVEQSGREVRVGDTVLVNLFLDTEGAEINVLEGKIHVLGNILIKDIHTGGSVFSVWQTQPTVSGKEIDFVGGTQGSVTGDNNKVFTVAIKPLSIGNFQLETLSFQGYLADGKGTMIVGKHLKSVPIKVGELIGQPIDDLALQEKDVIPPKPFTIEVGRENGSSDGKIFLSFISSDNESGIDYYEVKEGNTITIVSRGVYVLQDQNYSGKVTVTAYDNAGNTQTQTITLGNINRPWVIYLTLLLLLVFLVYLGIRYNKEQS